MMIPEPPRYYDSNWELLSQGAEARVWLVPNFITRATTNTGTNTGTNTTNNTGTNPSKSLSFTSDAICKERFVKSYRHPALNDKLTRARTKAEAKSLSKCRRGGVSVPVILGIDIPPASTSSAISISASSTSTCGNGSNGSGGSGSTVPDNDNVNNDNNNSSACLFLEKIEGCTLRSFFAIKPKKASRSTATATTNEGENGGDEGQGQVEGEAQGQAEAQAQGEEPATKRAKLENANTDEANTKNNNNNTPHTRLDAYAKKVAHTTGIVIGKMHNINIIHGDLTTSNILLRNPNDVPPPLSSSVSSSSSSSSTDTKLSWEPDIVMIDFGLSSTSVNTSSKNKNSSSSSHEERAVDLYVLERAFITTHVGGEVLVDEMLRGYKSSCKCSDSVFQRLSQVRLRGRKRECFG